MLCTLRGTRTFLLISTPGTTYTYGIATINIMAGVCRVGSLSLRYQCGRFRNQCDPPYSIHKDGRRNEDEELKGVNPRQAEPEGSLDCKQCPDINGRAPRTFKEHTTQPMEHLRSLAWQ